MGGLKDGPVRVGYGRRTAAERFSEGRMVGGPVEDKGKT